MKIQLQNPVEKVIVQEKRIVLSEINVQRVVDITDQKICKVFIKELGEPIVIWEGAAYDAAGQWTDTDVQNRLNVILSGSKTASQS